MSEESSSPHCLSWLLAEFPIDTRSAWNIQEYFRRQQLSAGAIPHDRLIVVEGSRDEVGDPRIIVQSCFGRRVNGLLGLLLSREVQNRTGIEPQMLYNDDGILLRCSDVNTPSHFDLLEGLSVSMAEGVVMK
jgi:ATP-dependent Lhr-like helicase